MVRTNSPLALEGLGVEPEATPKLLPVVKTEGLEAGQEKQQPSTTHGQSGHRNKKATPAYVSWYTMKARCLNPNRPQYPKYGGSGVTICERWLNSFDNFFEDMGERPQGHTLDRFPNQAGNYEPSNCRWATPKQQTRNRAKTTFVNCQGRRIPLGEAAERCGMNYGVLLSFLYRNRDFSGDVSELVFQPRTKLTESIVRIIRSSNKPSYLLAAEYEVTQQLIYAIRIRKIWRHVV